MTSARSPGAGGSGIAGAAGGGAAGPTGGALGAGLPACPAVRGSPPWRCAGQPVAARSTPAASGVTSLRATNLMLEQNSITASGGNAFFAKEPRAPGPPSQSCAQLRVLAAVGEVDHEPDRQPDPEAQ